MGAVCCEDVHENNLVFLSQKPLKQDYVQAEWPKQDEYIKFHLSELKKQNQQPLKHNSKNLYYLGDWKTQLPSGSGLLYCPDKFLYTGLFQRGLPEGQGKCQLISSQCNYQGNFRSGQASGQGTFQNNKEEYTFSGSWVDSRPTIGQLKFKNNKTVIQFTQYSKKQAIINYEDGKVYTGQIQSKGFLPNGVGNVTFPDKSTYRGGWLNGKMHGNGIFEWRHPQEIFKIIQKYDGQYQFGKKHGFGKFNFASGNTYQGSWANGKMEGNGKLTDKNGKQLFNGIWQNGEFKQNYDWNKQSHQNHKVWSEEKHEGKNSPKKEEKQYGKNESNQKYQQK